MKIVHYAKSVNEVYACGQKFGLVSFIPSQVTCPICEVVVLGEQLAANQAKLRNILRRSRKLLNENHSTEAKHG